LPPSMPVVDVGERMVVPGLIDLHVHGAAGHSFDEPDTGAHRRILRFHARHGVTAMHASLVSAERADLDRRLAALAVTRAAGRGGDGAALLGVHLEGPFLALAQCGAHDPAVLRSPGRDDIDWLLRQVGIVSMVTLAPELPGAVEMVRRLAGAGIVVAAGHSEARGTAFRSAVDAGLLHLTHLWSGQSGLVRQGPWRVPGLLEESLASTGLTAEVIADGRHLPPVLLEIARRCLPDRVAVVSDATAGTGMPSGHRYGLGAVTCEVRDGVGMVVGADAFGGSVTPMDAMLAYLHRDLGWSLDEVIGMTSRVPARVVGLSARKGDLAPGYDADVTVLNHDFSTWGTLVGGVWAYRSDRDG
jgi:N-acetylglucosamine-6-phosphate deacetylase